MGKLKSGSKKPKGGVDFKKIKRKIGRKLPPPKNATNTQIKSKAIVLPEQSIATEREGLAVSNKGQTLRELLRQTSHHNAKIRKAQLNGIKDLLLKHPEELKLHTLFIIEKLRERICDNDKGVRETLYELLKSVVFPSSKEDITGSVISLMMSYIFNAMTHIAVDIRLMAFKFFELVVLNYPSSFTLYADKVFDNYVDILRNQQIYLVDKSKLKNVLGGLLRCFSLLSIKKDQEDVQPRGLFYYRSEVNASDNVMPSIAGKLEDLVPILVGSFLESTKAMRAVSVFDAQVFDCMSWTLNCIDMAVKAYGIKYSHVTSELHPTLISTRAEVTQSIMLVYLRKLWEAFPIGQMYDFQEKEDNKYVILNVKIAEIFLHVSSWIDGSSSLDEKFLAFVEALLLQKVGIRRAHMEKRIISVLPFIPKLLSQVLPSWKTRLLEAFTNSFKECKVDSKMSIVYLSSLEELLISTNGRNTLTCHEIAWIQELPRLLLQAGHKHPSFTLVVLRLLLQVGQCSTPKSERAIVYDHLQYSLKEFYGTKTVEGPICHGPFLKLPTDCKELAICILYYFSSMTSDLLDSLSFCCLSNYMEPSILFRMIEVLHSAYKDGRILFADHISFLVTLVARFKVFPERYESEVKIESTSNRSTFRFLTISVITCLSQMGDKYMLLKLLSKTVFNEMQALKPSLETMNALLKVITALDTRPTKISEDDLINLSNWLLEYMVEAVSYVPENIDTTIQVDQNGAFHYFMKPTILLFFRSDKLLSDVLKMLDSFINDESLLLTSRFDKKYSLDISSRVHAVASIIISLHTEVRLRERLSSNKTAIRQVLLNIRNLIDSDKSSITLEQMQKIQVRLNQLKSIYKSQSWDERDVEGI